MVGRTHEEAENRVREWLATIRGSEDLVNVGAYVPGANPRIDAALAKREALESFLRQPADDLVTFGAAVDALSGL
jgi:flagellar biosynthesis/type III secretory pathway ATPase